MNYLVVAFAVTYFACYWKISKTLCFLHVLYLFSTDSGAGGLVNPNKTYETVEKEGAVGHELYRKSHLDFDVGEQLVRSYTSPNFQNTNKFGIPTPHDNTGMAPFIFFF